jgi:hypothetical protein
MLAGYIHDSSVLRLGMTHWEWPSAGRAWDENNLEAESKPE